MTRFSTFLLAATVGLCLAVGCGPRRDQTRVNRNPLPKDESEYVAMIAIDLSPSFQTMMAEDGQAYAFVRRVIDKYFRDRSGADHDLLLLTKISGDQRSIFWQGTPEAFHRRFPTPQDFRDELVAASAVNGSLVHDGILNGLKQMLSFPNVASGKANSVLLVLSDLEDNGPNPDESERRLFDAIVKYLRLGGHCGFYYADQLRMAHWREKFGAAGFSFVPVNPKEQDSPPLPEFE